MEIVNKPAVFSTSGNPMVFVLRVPEYNKPKFRLKAEIVVYYFALQYTVPALELFSDESGSVRVDVSKILHHLPSVELPSDLSGGFFVSDKCKISYTVKFSATWDNGYQNLESEMMTAFRATMPPSSQLSLLEYLSVGKNYLSFTPDVVDTVKNGVHYFYFMNTGNQANFTVKIRARYKDNSAREISAIRFSVAKYGVCILPVGLFHYGFLLEWGELSDYSVWVENDLGEIAGKPIRFVLRSFELPCRCVLFENSIGGFDTAIVFLQKDTLKIEREESSAGGLISSDVVDIENTKECTSGYIPNRMVALFRELLVSQRAYFCEGTKLEPVNLLKGSFSLREYTSDLNSIELKVCPAFVNHMFRDEITPLLSSEIAALATRDMRLIASGEDVIGVRIKKELRV